MDVRVGAEQSHIVVIYTDAGGGHRATAEALREILEAAGGYRVTLVNAYQEVLPHLDLYARYTSRDVEATYNDLILREGRTGWFCMLFYVGAVLNVKLLTPAGRKAFRALWEREKPDMVVSVLPVINDLMLDSLKGYGDGRTPFAVLMTDWAEMSRSVWFPRSKAYHAICGTDISQRQVAKKPHPADKLHPMDGLLTRPVFVDRPAIDTVAERQALGLDPDKPVACMLYGGHGSWRMLELGKALAAERTDVQVLFLCGRNEALAEALTAATLPFPHRVVGFTREVHRYMALSDIFIGKTGPLSVSEAVAYGLPLLIDRSHVLPQERAVLKWISKTQSGEHFSTPAQFVAGLNALIARGAKRVEAGDTSATANQAARQIPGILGRILAAAVKERV